MDVSTTVCQPGSDCSMCEGKCNAGTSTKCGGIQMTGLPKTCICAEPSGCKGGVTMSLNPQDDICSQIPEECCVPEADQPDSCKQTT